MSKTVNKFIPIDISITNGYVEAACIPIAIANELIKIPHSQPLLEKVEKRKLITEHQWKFSALTEEDWTMLDNDVWSSLPKIRPNSFGEYMKKEEWDKYQAVFDQSKNKPEWELYATFYDEQNEKRNANRKVRDAHLSALNDEVKKGTFTLLTNNHVPTDQIEFGSKIPVAEVKPYLAKLGFEIKDSWSEIEYMMNNAANRWNIREITEERRLHWLNLKCWSIGEVHFLLYGLEPVSKYSTDFPPIANAGDDVDKLNRAIHAGWLKPLNPDATDEKVYFPPDVIKVAEELNIGDWQSWKQLQANKAASISPIPEILSLYQLVNLLNQDQVFLREALEKLRAIEANRPEKFQSTYTQATASRALVTYWIKRSKLACCDVNQDSITDVDQVRVNPGESGNWADAFDMLDSTMEIKSSDLRSLIFSEEMSMPAFLQESRQLTLTFPYGVTHLSIDECAAIIAEAEYPKNHNVPPSTILEADRERRIRQKVWGMALRSACHDEITPYNPDNPMLTETSPMDGRALLSLIEFLNWLSVQSLSTPIGCVGNALCHGKASHTLLNAFIEQQEAMLERQQEGRYLLEEVAGIICHKFPAEDSKRLLERLINDATHSTLTVYKLGENLKLIPKSAIGLDGLPSLEVVKEWSTEAHWDDLNEWITTVMPKLPFRFAEPKSKSGFNKSESIDSQKEEIQSKDDNRIPGKMPKNRINKLAVQIAWKIECASNKPATYNEVFDKLKEYATSNEKPDVADFLLDSDKSEIYWRNDAYGESKFSRDACGKAIKSWNRSRANGEKTESKESN